MCRPDGRHVLNNQGTDDYVLTNKEQIPFDNPHVGDLAKPI